MKHHLSNSDDCGKTFVRVCSHRKQVLKATHTEKIFISEWARLKIKHSSRALELLAVAGIKMAAGNV